MSEFSDQPMKANAKGRVLFGRVGWMKRYEGPQPGDEKPTGGGAYNEEHFGTEGFNFRRIDGKVWGVF